SLLQVHNHADLSRTQPRPSIAETTALRHPSQAAVHRSIQESRTQRVESRTLVRHSRGTGSCPQGDERAVHLFPAGRSAHARIREDRALAKREEGQNRPSRKYGPRKDRRPCRHLRRTRSPDKPGQAAYRRRRRCCRPCEDRPSSCRCATSKYCPPRVKSLRTLEDRARRRRLAPHGGNTADARCHSAAPREIRAASRTN